MKFAPIRARFLVVRHGQSLWNIEQRWQGRADIDLSDHGIAQARAAASKLGGFDFIASSNLRRALDTAQSSRSIMAWDPFTSTSDCARPTSVPGRASPCTK
ncbi:MAG: histidine phosphatase family protein [Actinobacteria bacterium]|nr:histidine phosphatase family protein [Actinomycetota bacterium]